MRLKTKLGLVTMSMYMYHLNFEGGQIYNKTKEAKKVDAVKIRVWNVNVLLCIFYIIKSQSK